MFRTTRRVEFRDTDAAGIVHFSAFFPIMESVEHEFLRSRSIAVLPHVDHSSDPNAGESLPDELIVTWPRVSASCDYQSAARFEDILEIELSVNKIGQTSVRYEFEFQRSDNDGQTRIALGALTAVCCRLDAGNLTKVPIPDVLRKKLEDV